MFLQLFGRWMRRRRGSKRGHGRARAGEGGRGYSWRYGALASVWLWCGLGFELVLALRFGIKFCFERACSVRFDRTIGRSFGAVRFPFRCSVRPCHYHRHCHCRVHCRCHCCRPGQQQAHDENEKNENENENGTATATETGIVTARAKWRPQPFWCARAYVISISNAIAVVLVRCAFVAEFLPMPRPLALSQL